MWSVPTLSSPANTSQLGEAESSWGDFLSHPRATEQRNRQGSDGKGKFPFKKHAFLGLILLLFLVPVTIRLCKTSQLFLDTAFLMAFIKEACPPSLGREEKPRREMKCPSCLLIPVQGRPLELPVAACPGPSRWHSWMVFLPDHGQHLPLAASAAPCQLPSRGQGCRARQGCTWGCKVSSALPISSQKLVLRLAQVQG